MVTLKDIARECGVSFSTVSKALKGSSEISEETIQMIQQKASEMGYHPNIAARTLRTNRTYDIGVIFEDKTGSGFQHQYFAKIISGLQEIVQDNGYDLTFTGGNFDSKYDYYKHIVGRNFDGVVILSADFKRPDLLQVISSGIPTATLDYVYNSNHISVVSDNKQGMTELTEYIISQGHKKIAMIHGENTMVTRERIQFFKETAQKHNIQIPEEYFVQALYHDPEKSARATEYLLSLPEPPTCILFPDDYSALGGIQELNKRKIIPGKDISIAGYDGIMLTSMLLPPLTTYEQNGKEMGRAMAQGLIDLIEGKLDKSAPAENKASEENSKHLLISGRLLKGGTVAKI